MGAPVTKVCFKCRRQLPLDEFYRHQAMSDGHLGKCKDCAKADVKKNYAGKRAQYSAYDRERTQRPERKEQMAACAVRRRQREPEKYKARTSVANAVRDGRLVPCACEVCGNLDVQAHHDDYSKPLEVRWLCFVHHRAHHGQVVTATHGAKTFRARKAA